MSPVVMLRILIALAAALSSAALVLGGGGAMLWACGDESTGAIFITLGAVSGALALGSIAVLAVGHAVWATSQPSMYPPRDPR